MNRTNGTAGLAWTAMELPGEPSPMRDRVSSVCRSYVNGSALDDITPKLVSFSVECPVQINTSSTTITWNHVPSPALSDIATMQYVSTCIQDACTPQLAPTDTLTTVQQAAFPRPGNYSVHLRLKWTTSSSREIQCEAFSSIEVVASSSSGDSSPTNGTTHVLVVIGIVSAVAIVLVALGRFVYVRRRHSRSKGGAVLDTPVDAAPPVSLAPPSSAPPSSWFESIYHNDHGLPASILHDDRYTRAILRSSVPSDKDMSFHSHSELFDAPSLRDDTPAVSLASSSCSSLSNAMTTPWHDFHGGGGARSPGNSSYNSSANSSRFDQYPVSDLDE